VNFFATLARCPRIRSAVLALAALINTVLPQSASGAEEIGIAPVNLGAGPYCFDTAEQHDIRVDILAHGLTHAYSLAFLPNADALIVERGTRLRLIRNATAAKPLLVDTPIAGIPNITGHEN